jgi:IS1 family transposase
MQLSDHSLRQIDEAYLERLGEAELRALLIKAMEDLKEARERLNQNSHNSSVPPSHEAPWKKTDQASTESEDEEDNDDDDDEDKKRVAKIQEKETEEKGDKDPEDGSSTTQNTVKAAPRSVGKQKGAPGYGRKAPEKIDLIELHAPESCAGCTASLHGTPAVSYTGHYEVNVSTTASGLQVIWTKHLWQESECACGHITRAQPPRWVENGIELGGFRLIGADLATLIIALSLRYRMSHRRIQEFLGDWLGIGISLGALSNIIKEVGVLLTPVEAELIEAVQQSELLHADETPWPEQGAKQLSLWLWVFTAATVTLYFISHRGQELVRNLLGNYTGVLMSDGWQAYRWLENRLRCWAHLKRKAVGLTENYNAEARSFGQAVLDLWENLREEVCNAREGPANSIKENFEIRLRVFQAQCEAACASSHKKTRALAGEFLNDWDAIFAVLNDPRLPLTNNAAERALRHWVILRLITHGTRTELGSRNLALLASVIDTCRQRRSSPWNYLATAIKLRRKNRMLLPLPV